MAVVLVPIVSRYGAEAVIPVAIMAGGLVMAMGLFGLGRAVTFIPWPVVEGFTIGIATIIFLQQVPLALNMPKPEGENTALVALTAIATADWRAALPALATRGAGRRADGAAAEDPQGHPRRRSSRSRWPRCWSPSSTGTS